MYDGTQQQNIYDRVARERDGGPKRRGTGNGRARLTEDQARTIIQEYPAVRSYQKLADKYNVNKTTIAYLVRRQTWSNIEY